MCPVLGGGHDSGRSGLASAAAGWLGLVGNGDRDGVAPDICVGDSLTAVTLGWRVPATSLRWCGGVAGLDCLSHSDCGDASWAILRRLGHRCRCNHWWLRHRGGRWCRSGIGVRVVRGNYWIARCSGPDGGGQVGGVISSTGTGCDGSRARDETGLCDRLSSGEGCERNGR